jgi:hypothetical protein
MNLLFAQNEILHSRARNGVIPLYKLTGSLNWNIHVNTREYFRLGDFGSLVCSVIHAFVHTYYCCSL